MFLEFNRLLQKNVAAQEEPEVPPHNINPIWTGSLGLGGGVGGRGDLTIPP